MAQRSRHDYPGSWHHVINRGLAKRPLFEDRIDIRFFLSRLAREVRRGRLEVHAYCILTTHFHLLVRSPVGELSEALRRAQNEYSLFFNRRHKRDGTLVRGRFRSKLVESHAYRGTLVRYIDRNPVRAGLARAPWSYPWSSAARYVFGNGPPWLERSWVESEARSDDASPFRGTDYVREFGAPLGEAAERFVEDRILHASNTSDELDDLIGAAPTQVLAWMRRKAMLADGVEIGLPVCDAPSIRTVVERMRVERGDWKVSPNGRQRSVLDLIEVGLLRVMASLTWQQVAIVLGAPRSSCQRRHDMHRRLVLEDAVYARTAAEIGTAVLGACHALFGRRGENG